MALIVIIQEINGDVINFRKNNFNIISAIDNCHILNMFNCITLALDFYFLNSKH